jgi:prepilin-type N-terminal cleavage/methylation domain-containing protein
MVRSPPLPPPKGLTEGIKTNPLAGFTLLELLITLSVMGILFSMALPSFRSRAYPVAAG